MPPRKIEQVRIAEPLERQLETAHELCNLAVEPAIAEAETTMSAEVAKQQILAHRQVRHDRLPPAILGDKSDPRADRFSRRAWREQPALEPDFAAGARAKAKQRLHGLGSPRANEASKAQDLAAMKVEGHIAHERRRAQGRTDRIGSARSSDGTADARRSTQCRDRP
jgi:hypothetical protein